MRKTWLVLGTVLVASLGMARAKSNATQEKPKDTQAATDEFKISQEDVDKKNPVKPSPEGLAAARKIYGYDCAMCHGPKGDGKGDIVESMKLTMHDWNDRGIARGQDGRRNFLHHHQRQGQNDGRGRSLARNHALEHGEPGAVFLQERRGDKPAS